MDKPIIVIYHSPGTDPEDIKGNLPDNTRYPLRYAEEAWLEKVQAGNIITQAYRNYLFYMEVFQFDLDEPLQLTFSVDKPSVFFCAMLTDDICFLLPDGRPAATLSEGSCYATFNNPGTFGGELKEGKHDLVYINPRTEWLWRHVNVYAGLREFLQQMESGCRQYRHMPRVLLESGVGGFLTELIALEENVESGHFAITNALLDMYHGQAVSRLKETAYEIRQFIERNFTDRGLMKISIMARRLSMYPKKLERCFHTEFGMMPAAYIHWLQMEHARCLLMQGHSVNYVAEELGYSSSSNFTRAFKTFFGYPPGSVHPK